MACLRYQKSPFTPAHTYLGCVRNHAIGVTDLGAVTIERHAVKPLRANEVAPTLRNLDSGRYPLNKSASTLVGVPNLLIPPGIEVDEHRLAHFSVIARQIGIAITNARLYQETKSISLRAPLSCLANRRFMAIQLGKCFDAAKRYGETIATIMVDFDHFKGVQRQLWIFGR
jgi:GAF domain-containing protein